MGRRTNVPRTKEITDAEIYILVEKIVLSDNRANDPSNVANEHGHDWSQENAMKWDQNYARCMECEHWFECGELVNVNGDEIPCEECRDERDFDSDTD